MTRLGLGPNWRCTFANDIDGQKCTAYRENFGGDHLTEGSIAALTLNDLPESRPDLAWASFPCQDLSLAGPRGGMAAARSGMFFQFWRLMGGLCDQGRAPKIIAIENVPGLLTSNDGKDFAAIIGLLAAAGYRIGAQIIDAKSFTPQSRPRLFIIGFSKEVTPPATTAADAASLPAPHGHEEQWVALPSPHIQRNSRLRDLIDAYAQWDGPDRTSKLVDMMSPTHRARIDALIKARAWRVGAGFRRTRQENGHSVQRFEVRFDGLAGCLRTPAGGSSRQIIIEVKDAIVRSRLMTPLEAARLMGLPEDYILPPRANAALKLCGDGVCVTVVRWLSETILEPALLSQRIIAAA